MPKKTKAVKQSDIKGRKPWLRKQGLTIIDTPKINPQKTFLIVCEGQTEEFYFKSFPSTSITVKCYNLGCTNFQIVDCTIDLKKEAPYDQVWVVFDMDFTAEKGKKQFEQFDNAIKKAISHGIRVAYSNDCFELWFYLHYQYTDQKNLRSFYYSELSRYWGINYEKEGKVRAFSKKIYNLLQSDEKASIEDALSRSKQLHENLQSDPYHKQNPVTTVYQLYLELSGVNT